MTRSGFILDAGDGRENANASTQFESVEEAWLRASARLIRPVTPGTRPVGRRAFCEPQDIVAALSHLRRQRRLSQREIDVLCRFGHLNRPPDKRVPTEWESAQLWTVALGKVASTLREKGGVVGRGAPFGKESGHG